MEKFNRLMSKWWFRLVLFAGFGLIVIISTIITAILTGNPNHPASFNALGVEREASFIVNIVAYVALLLMYFTCDILNNLKVNIGKFLRKLLMIVSFVVYLVCLIAVGVIFIKDSMNGQIKNAFVAGLTLAPLMTYPIVYFFIAGKFEETKDGEPNRLMQFILIMVSLLLPILLGSIIMLIILKVGGKGVTYGILIALMALIGIGFFVSFKRNGILHDKVYVKGSSSDSSSGSGYSSNSSSSSDDASNRNVESISSWAKKLQAAIENCGGQNYMRVTCDARTYSDSIELDVKIDMGYVIKNMPDMARSQYEFLASDIERKWREVAANCPYNSQLSCEPVDR